MGLWLFRTSRYSCKRERRSNSPVQSMIKNNKLHKIGFIQKEFKCLHRLNTLQLPHRTADFHSGHIAKCAKTLGLFGNNILPEPLLLFLYSRELCPVSIPHHYLVQCAVKVGPLLPERAKCHINRTLWVSVIQSNFTGAEKHFRLWSGLLKKTGSRSVGQLSGLLAWLDKRTVFWMAPCERNVHVVVIILKEIKLKPNIPGYICLVVHSVFLKKNLLVECKCESLNIWNHSGYLGTYKIKLWVNL